MWCGYYGRGSFLPEVRGSDNCCSACIWGLSSLSSAHAYVCACATGAAESADARDTVVRVRGVPDHGRPYWDVLLSCHVYAPVRRRVAVRSLRRVVWSTVDGRYASFYRVRDCCGSGAGVAGGVESADAQAVGQDACHHRCDPLAAEVSVWDGSRYLHAVGAGSGGLWSRV